MSWQEILVLALISWAYAGYFIWSQRSVAGFGAGETPQESHNYFEGTTWHCYRDGTRILFDRRGNVLEFYCGGSVVDSNFDR